MDEKKFEEILLKNNKHIYNEMNQMMDKKLEQAMSKNNQYIFKEMDQMMDKKLEQAMSKNNQYIFKEMDQMMDKKLEQAMSKNNQYIFQEMDKRFQKIEQKRIDDNFYFEKTYGEKIDIIFDKIQSLEDIMIRNEKENQKYRELVDHHDNLLYSYDFRISKLEEQFGSE